MSSARRIIDDLRELAAKTSTPAGAQRIAYTQTWRDARAWFTDKVGALGLEPERDAAGNLWVTLEGESTATIIIGSHLDSTPNGGWLDGCFGVVAGIEVLRRYAADGEKPPVTIKVVDWCDEEGARFGRSLLGSAASAGTLNVEDVRPLKDRQGVLLVDALRENGLDLDRFPEAHGYLKAIDAKAYLEVHIEQGPVLEAMGKPTGVVIGTFGVERHMIRFTGQAAHSGSTPIEMRKDAFLACAETALACREIAKRHSKPGAGVVCTVGVVNVEPKFVTAVPGGCEMSLDQRALDPNVLAKMLTEAKDAAERAARENGVTVEWKHLLRISPRPFDPALLDLARASMREETGELVELPSGPLHDASEMAPLVPTVMVFSSSSRGLSHCKEEDTPEAHLETTIGTFMRLVDKTVAHVASRR
ncbi:Zn-dependent hydrolase [Myxococcota bacterium]|nr:Zn-dependent hydrolase [Myxococcota bacterium]